MVQEYPDAPSAEIIAANKNNANTCLQPYWTEYRLYIYRCCISLFLLNISDAWNVNDDKHLLEGQGESQEEVRRTYGQGAAEERLKFLTEYLNDI